jgi:hypothetical protein
VPMTAQDRVRRGPLAALLILLGLFLTSGATFAGYDLRAPASRLGPSRQGASAALLPPATRNPLDDEASGAGADPALAASEPAIVTERLRARPVAEVPPLARSAVPQPGSAPYRARAPPAS